MLASRKRLLLSTLLLSAATLFSFSQYRSAIADSYDGLWEGNFDINGEGNYRFIALYVNGVAIGHTPDARVIYKGDVSFEEGRYRSDMTMFFMTGSPMDTVTLEGTLSEDGQIVATYRTHGAGDQGKLTLNRQSDRKAALAMISGSWILYRGFQILKLDIADDGAISGGNTAGCAYRGKMEPLNPDYNAYGISLAATSCNNLNGLWSGMAYLADGITANDTLQLHLFEEDWAMLLPIVRNTDTRLIDKNKQWEP